MRAARGGAALRLRTLALAAAALGTAAPLQSAWAAEPVASARPVAAKAAPGKAPATTATTDDVDQDLLEFLGSVDTQTDDSSWFDFLRATDIGKLAKEKSAPAAPQEKKR